MPPVRRTPPKPAPKKKPPTKKGAVPPKKTPPKKPIPAQGLLGQTLVQNLKKAPTGTSQSAIVMQTLRSVQPAQLKAELLKATPKQRSQLFSALPADQIRSILGELDASVLAPVQPPPPPPSPRGGPPSTILQTTYSNVPYPPAQGDPDWASKVSNGSTIGLTTPPPWEWVSVYDHTREKEGSLENPAVGLTGWVVAHQPTPLSDGDVWFVHPFGFDFEFFIVPDPQYEALLGSTNTGRRGTKVVDTEYDGATQHAQKVLGLPAKKGVLGVETDQDLVPPSFRPWLRDGARVATFGRWIVDCGHDDFHTEVHPPLVMAVATPMPPPAGVHGASEMTHLEIMSRPYTVSQHWPDGNFARHLLVEVAKVETTIFGIPLSWRVEAHPTVYTTPYDGRPYIKLLVKPPVGRSGGGRVGGLRQQQLTVSYHFTHRHGVAVQVFDAGNDTVGIIIVLGDLNPAALPQKHDLTVQWDELGQKYSWLIDGLQIADILTLDIAPAIILNRGILTDRYDAPQASSPLDNQNVAAPVAIDHVQQNAGLSEDDAQPFPIYGWLNCYWQEVEVVAKGPPLP